MVLGLGLGLGLGLSNDGMCMVWVWCLGLWWDGIGGMELDTGWIEMVFYVLLLYCNSMYGSLWQKRCLMILDPFWQCEDLEYKS